MADLEGGYGYDSNAFNAMPRDQIRQGFVRKVYGTLGVQLVITALIAAPICTASTAWIIKYQGLVSLASVGLIVLCVMMMCGCATNMMRKHPTNLIMLGLFTLFESIIVGFTCAMYEVQSVVMCFGITAAMVVGLSLYAAVTKTDFTSYLPYLFGAALGLFVVGIIGIFTRSPMLDLVYSYGGALLFSAYLVIDTQMIVGGKNGRMEFGVDDYAYAALMVYMDIIRMFIFMLRILGKQRRN